MDHCKQKNLMTQAGIVLSQGEHEFEVDGLKLAYTVRGQGPLMVVQAPGWGIGSTYLENGLAYLVEHFTLVYFEPRGNGRSSRPRIEAEMSTEHMVADLDLLRRHLGVEQLTLFGHSRGATIVLGYAERFPERVERLILTCRAVSGRFR